jgi:hypothetical protein
MFGTCRTKEYLKYAEQKNIWSEQNRRICGTCKTKEYLEYVEHKNIWNKTEEYMERIERRMFVTRRTGTFLNECANTGRGKLGTFLYLRMCSFEQTRQLIIIELINDSKRIGRQTVTPYLMVLPSIHEDVLRRTTITSM